MEVRHHVLRLKRLWRRCHVNAEPVRRSSGTRGHDGHITCFRCLQMKRGGKLMRVLKALCCATVLMMALAPSTHADTWDKKTILTFSGPVQIPGATLPAGSYVFKLADIPGNRHVVQVFDKAEKKIYTTMLAIPNQRLEPSDKPIILFSERAAGSP